MTISESTTLFHQKKVVQYDPDIALQSGQDIVYRLSLEYDDKRKMPDLIAGFLEKTDKNTLEALVIGMWGDPYEAGADEVMAALIAHAPQLPNLRALFIGDMTYEECEISWIVQGSYKPLLDAFPLLQELRIRGGNELVIEPFAHQHLRRFTIEAGGLDQKIAEALAQSSMPHFFFKDPAPAEIYTLALHGALPIWNKGPGSQPGPESSHASLRLTSRYFSSAPKTSLRSLTLGASAGSTC